LSLKPLCSTLAAALALCGSAHAASDSYQIDPTHTFVIYEIGHYGTTTNRGRFSTSDGKVEIDRSAHTGRVDITLDISSIDTGVDALNKHIQSKDFFNAARYPIGHFVSDQVLFNGEAVSEVQGQLTLLDQTHPVTLKAQRFNCYQSPMLKREICGGDFEATIQRSDWGITWGLGFGFEDKVHLLIQIEAVKSS